MQILRYFVLLSFLCGYSASFSQNATEMEKISRGTFVPLYGSNSIQVVVQDFLLDELPVTNQQYLTFVKGHTSWSRSQVISLFADEGYLSIWDGDFLLGKDMKPNSPVTSVSWYAAKEYCASINKRLPTMDEWEYAAMANETSPNAQEDSLFNQRIIEGYETPKTYKKEVGSTFKNYWGIYDLHGLVWEWTYDFNSVLISGESRKDVDTDKNLFCAGGSVGASDLMDYAAFMRYAFRGSIKANYNIRNLGFRCAKTIE